MSRVTINGNFEELIIFGITTNLNDFKDFHYLGFVSQSSNKIKAFI